MAKKQSASEWEVVAGGAVSQSGGRNAGYLLRPHEVRAMGSGKISKVVHLNKEVYFIEPGTPSEVSAIGSNKMSKVVYINKEGLLIEPSTLPEPGSFEGYEGNTAQTALPVSGEDQAEILKRERDALFVQVQFLESRVAAERQRAEEARVELARVRTGRDKLLETHGIAVEGSRELQRVLIAKDADALRMIESFHGLVEHVHEDQVVVVYETEDDLIEHVYEREQFADGCLPEKGERVIVSVFLASLNRASAEKVDLPDAEPSEEAIFKKRKNVIRGPHSF